MTGISLVLVLVGCESKEIIEPDNQVPEITNLTLVEGLTQGAPTGTAVLKFSVTDADGKVVGVQIEEGSDKFAGSFDPDANEGINNIHKT